jgi:hypothetical protein
MAQNTKNNTNLIREILISFQNAFSKYTQSSHGLKSSSFNLRLILWEAGVTVSNKVLECLVLRSDDNIS